MCWVTLLHKIFILTGPANTASDNSYKPSFLTDHELKHLILEVSSSARDEQVDSCCFCSIIFTVLSTAEQKKTILTKNSWSRCQLQKLQVGKVPLCVCVRDMTRNLLDPNIGHWIACHPARLPNPLSFPTYHCTWI